MQHKKSLLALCLTTSLLAGCGGSDSNSPAAAANTAPVISGDPSPTVAENLTMVGSYTATDAQGDAIDFSLAGTDAALFAIDNSGNLSFVSAPDYDHGDVGPYAITVVATDDGQGALSGQFGVTVSVSNEVDPATHAVVQTIAADYVSGSEVMFIDGQSQQVTGPYLVRTQTDYTINTYQSHLYHIGSYFIDTIEKFHVDDLDSQLWHFATKDPGVSGTHNPYTLVSVDENKAYLIQHQSDKVWIVNPQATAGQPELFKIGELDLAPYNFDNTTPNATAAVIAEGKLYIAMQRFSADFSQIGTTYIAVFDTTTDQEIQTNSDASAPLKGIALQGSNVARNGLISANGKLYLTTTKPFFEYAVEALAMSKIEEIDPTDYSVRTLLDASAIADNTTATLKGAVVVNATKGYFYTSAFDASYNETSTLYEFDPTTGAIVSTGVAGNSTQAINYAVVDQSNILWISIATPTNPGIELIDTASNTQIGNRLSTELSPHVIRFIE